MKNLNKTYISSVMIKTHKLVRDGDSTIITVKKIYLS